LAIEEGLCYLLVAGPSRQVAHWELSAAIFGVAEVSADNRLTIDARIVVPSVDRFATWTV